MKRWMIVVLLIFSSYMSAMNNEGTLSPRRQIRSLPVGAGSGLGQEVQRMILGSVGKAAGQVVGGVARGAAEAALRSTEVSGSVAGVRFKVGGRRSSDESESSGIRRSTSHDHLSTPRGLDHQEVKPRAQEPNPVPRLKLGDAEASREGSGKGSRKNRSRSGSSGSEKDSCDPKTREHEHHVAALQQQIGGLIKQLNIPREELAEIQDVNRSRLKKEKDKRFQDCKNLEALIKMLELMERRRAIKGAEPIQDSIQNMPEVTRTRVFGFMTEEELRQCLLYVASGLALSVASGAANRAASAAGSCSIQ